MTSAPRAICRDCEHEERHWDKLTYYDSSCRLEHRRHPVTGEKYLAPGGLCKIKNAHGDCKDFEQRSVGTEASGCLILLAAAALLAFLLFVWP